MAGCKLLQSIKRECQYKIAGVKSLFLMNWDLATQYTFDSDGVITGITPYSGGKIFQIDFVDNTASWTDDLTLVNNSQKYRVHTVNFQLGDYNKDVLDSADALSLGQFVAFVLDENNRIITLGRENGLSATVMNYASGAAEGDATSWSVVLAGNEHETGRLVSDLSVITSLVDNITVLTN
ncbi:hypothetical protein EZS27_004650 [termite gut metagenome]|uniref:Uncharacterized protein n=1 Tax=termite gut metagenome TaxID=433724 RepID=A0A5J4SRE7_9ZZZZ